jgi:hypothetical protein
MPHLACSTTSVKSIVLRASDTDVYTEARFCTALQRLQCQSNAWGVPIMIRVPDQHKGVRVACTNMRLCVR